MAAHTEISPAEAADRLAIRELFDAYAHCADRRDAEGQKALFTADTRFAVYMGGDGSEPTYVLDGREALTPVFADLNRYDVTTHFNGQSTIALDGDRPPARATRSPTTSSRGRHRKIMIASLRTSTRSRGSTAAGTSPSGNSSSTGARRARPAPGDVIRHGAI